MPAALRFVAVCWAITCVGASTLLASLTPTTSLMRAASCGFLLLAVGFVLAAVRPNRSLRS